MDPLSKAMSAASGGMNSQSFRIRVISENISNADTPGYHRKLVSFKNTYDHAKEVTMVQPGRVKLDRSEGEMLFEPEHPLAGNDGFIELSNVNLMTEITDAKEAGRSYEANLSTFKQAREMYAGLIDLLRR